MFSEHLVEEHWRLGLLVLMHESGAYPAAVVIWTRCFTELKRGGGLLVDVDFIILSDAFQWKVFLKCIRLERSRTVHSKLDHLRKRKK